MTTIIWFSIVIQAVSGYLFGPSKVTGALGGSVMVSCHYSPISANIYGRKFWCKMRKNDCFTIISSKNYIEPNYINRTKLQKYTDHFKINMTNLQQKDKGIYRCGIGNNNGHFYYTVNVTVSEGNKIPYSSEVIIANLKGSITINCPVLQEQSTGWMYWCKMHHQMDVPSCHTMVNSSGYVHEHFWGRVLIQEVSNTSDFKILVNNIKINDFGFYRCGTGKFEDGSDWTDIHIHILNPSDNIRHRNIKPLSRSPGELAVAQCQVPRSFHTVSLVYWCRWNETGCLRLIDSDGFIQKGFQNRISLNNTSRTYIMSLAQLDLGDSGYYWCVITDGQNLETSSVEVHVIAPTTTEIYLSSISRQTRRNSLTAATYSTDIPSSTDNTTHQQFITTARHQTGGASIVSFTAVLTVTTNSIQESTSTTSKNHVTGNMAEYTRAFLSTITDSDLTHSTIEGDNNQEIPINITLSPSTLKTLTDVLNPSHTVLTTEGSTSNNEQDNTTQQQFITTARHQTGGASIVQLTADPTPTTNNIQESTSSTSKNHVTGNIAEYTRAFLSTNTGTSLTHSTPIEQETMKTLYPRTSSRWQPNTKVYTPYIPVLTTGKYQESHISVTLSPGSQKTLKAAVNPSHTVLTTKGGKTSAEQENTTWQQYIPPARHQTGGASVPTPATNSIQESKTQQQFITPARHQTGGASIVQLTADPTPTTNNIQETIKELYPRTSSRWHTSSNVYTSYIPVLTTDYQDNKTQQPFITTARHQTGGASIDQLTADPTPTTNSTHTTWHQFITTARDQTGGASVPATATNSIQESTSTTSKNYATGNLLKYTTAFQPSNTDSGLTHSTPIEQGMDYSENITLHSTHAGSTMSETEENYGISHGYKVNSEVTLLLENSTVETQSKPGHNESRYQSQNPKHLILILFPVLAISCVIGFATLISVVKNVRKKREATDNSVHNQENVFMNDREPAEIAEESEILSHELTKYNNVFKETEV